MTSVPAPAAAAGALVDGLGGGAAPPASASSAAAAAAAPIVNVADCLKKLRASDNGLLYEDPTLQIGVKSQWQGNQGRVMFYLGNKTDGDVSSVSLELHPVSGLHARPRPRLRWWRRRNKCRCFWSSRRRAGTLSRRR